MTEPTDVDDASAGKAPRKRDRKATEAAFIAAAAEAFGDRGYDATSTKTIAKAAGYSEALINTYFGGKEGLFRAVLENQGRGSPEQAGFLKRPIGDSLAVEIEETITFMTANISQRSKNTRIVIARVLVDAGFVVPDLDQAVAFFIDVLGAAVLWKSAPVAGGSIDMEGMFAAEPGSKSRLAMMRLGPNLNVELVEYTVPVDRRSIPPSSDLSVGHLGFAVDDIDLAGTYLAAHGVRMLLGPRTNGSGPNQGQRSWFFKTPWGLVLELIQRPRHMPYESSVSARLFEQV